MSLLFSDKIKAVLFDLDGTLVDTAPDFVIAVNQLRREYQKTELDADLIRSTVSNGARALVSLALGLNEGEAGFEQARERLLTLYTQVLGHHSQLFEGLEELLTTLEQQGIPWGIATNKPELYTLPLLEKLALKPASVICPDHVKDRKPAPESIHLACKHIGCQSHEVIYVGDHKRDIECGNNAGATTIAALYGYIERDDNPESWQADHSVREAQKLGTLIASL